MNSVDILEAAQVHYASVRNALERGDSTVFPSDELDYAKEFRDLVAVKYPYPYKRFVPLLSAYWMLVDGEYWYVVHDMIVLRQIVARYLTQLPLVDVSKTSENAYNRLYAYQPDFFKHEWPGKTFRGNWWHMPEGWPIRMPPESVEYAMQSGMDLPTIPLVGSSEAVIHPVPHLPAKDRESIGSSSGIKVIAIVAGGIGLLWALLRRTS